ncbi:unnamed protein product [Rotaria magnacalcarata]|nr:unnamed protein product [Rotaria magnacalcarata]
MWSYSFKLKKPHYTIQPGDRDDYQPKTLHRHNQQRRQFLPAFPNSLEQSMHRAPLLLANVSAQKLSTIELTRRTSAAFVDPFNPKFIQKVPSYIYIEFQNLYGPLKTRLNVDAAVLDYNLYRIYEIIDIFIAKYQFYEGFNVLFDHHFQLPIHDQHLRMLKQSELIILLEFFLQIDVDVFNMKTCIFYKTDHQSPSINSLFLTDETIEYNYDMKPCGRLFCRVCQSNEDQCSQQMIEFSTSGHKHRFVNGYEAILNCPANCRTSNIIYVLTCTCGEYDYIGSTQHTLDDVIEYHRQNANRIIIEYLLNGEPFSNKCTCIPNEFHKQRANKMRLYQHLTHCSKALQLFLEDNPEYGCFIPMRMNEAQFDDLSYATLTQVDNQTQNSMKIDAYLTRVPKPPVDFSFSKRQQNEQRHFFQKFNCKQHFSYSTLDFYHATIVAVLPDHCSTMLRHMIEILFITHAETKLNSMNLYTGDNNHLYGVPYKSDRIWCDNLSYPTLDGLVSSKNSTTFYKLGEHL